MRNVHMGYPFKSGLDSSIILEIPEIDIRVDGFSPVVRVNGFIQLLMAVFHDGGPDSPLEFYIIGLF